MTAIKTGLPVMLFTPLTFPILIGVQSNRRCFMILLKVIIVRKYGGINEESYFQAHNEQNIVDVEGMLYDLFMAGDIESFSIDEKIYI